MTAPDLKAIQERAEKATPGPWRLCNASDGQCQCGLVWSIPADAVVAVTATVGEGDGVVEMQNHVANGKFIAHARTDIPTLLEHIARQDEVVRMLTEALEQAQKFTMNSVSWLNHHPDSPSGSDLCACTDADGYPLEEKPEQHQHLCIGFRKTIYGIRAALKAASEGKTSNG